VTVVASVPLVPEIRLHLITEQCALWHASESQAAALGYVEPYWAFAWPGGQALARYILDNESIVRNKRVLDFGSGCAIEGIAAALCGATSVLCADIDPRPCEAALSNARLNRVSLSVTNENLVGTPIDFDVILAGDVFYDSSRAVFDWLCAARSPVYIGDPSRGFVDLSQLHRLATYSATWDGDTTGTITRATGVYVRKAKNT
jgi:predicted nicotinamide N-methyase